MLISDWLAFTLNKIIKNNKVVQIFAVGGRKDDGDIPAFDSGYAFMYVPTEYAPKFEFNLPCIVCTKDYSSIKSAYVVIKTDGSVIMGFGVDTAGYSIVRIAGSYILTD
jgi:hypothetical protein